MERKNSFQYVQMLCGLLLQEIQYEFTFRRRTKACAWRSQKDVDRFVHKGRNRTRNSMNGSVL